MRVGMSSLLAIFVIVGAAVLTPSVRPSSNKAPRSEVSAPISEARRAQPASPVIVELFTSEGCSDCPPADQLLYRLEQTQPVPGAQIIALEQHVDYWDSEGWRDPFSSSQFTLRQRDYVYAFNLPSAYTPEMVVDGTAEFVGSDRNRALAAIAKAALVSKADLQIEQLPAVKSPAQDLPLRVTLSRLLDSSPKHGADVLLAVTEDQLASNVTRGENAGAHMNHFAVVRELRVLGRVDSSAGFSATPDLTLAANWKRDNLRVVAFVQDRSTKRILGASTLSLSQGSN
ncbi:MAG TPA: DUF1223 domain-containing protein [Candidatus Acidoferrum sp.]|nr:DUF1223 domain-containing protein [Candidatus Acidoferrum sp.]